MAGALSTNKQKTLPKLKFFPGGLAHDLEIFMVDSAHIKVGQV